MPTKKSATTKKIKTTRAIKKDIKKAVDKIPGLISEQIKWQNPTLEVNDDNSKTPTKPEYYQNNGEENKKKLLWLFVLIIAALVFLMWAWNLTVVFKDTNRNATNDFGLIDVAKEKYEATMKQNFIKDTTTNTLAQEKTIEEEKIKTSLKASLNKLLSNITSSTVSSTEKNITTTKNF
ncbi:MAG TPA: hypothetical protein DEB09_02690 [Candidatus Magasanikbacteria bacterium]|nr:hypothetical protein [Candidatus Magasanikbacteria bacterium]